MSFSLDKLPKDVLNIIVNQNFGVLASLSRVNKLLRAISLETIKKFNKDLIKKFDNDYDPVVRNGENEDDVSIIKIFQRLVNRLHDTANQYGIDENIPEYLITNRMAWELNHFKKINSRLEISSPDDERNGYFCKDKPETNLETKKWQKILNTAFLDKKNAHITLTGEDLTAKEIKQILNSLQSYLDNDLLGDSPLKGCMPVKQFHSLEANKLALLANKTLAENLASLLKNTNTNFRDYKNLNECKFRLILENPQAVIAYHQAGVDIKMLFNCNFKKLEIFLDKYEHAMNYIDIPFDFLSQLDSSFLYDYFFENTNYSEPLKEVLNAGVTPATLSHLRGPEIRRVVEDFERSTFILFLQRLEKALSIKTNRDNQKAQKFINELNLKGYLSITEFFDLSIEKLKTLIKDQISEVLLNLYKEYKLDFTKVNELKDDRFKELIWCKNILNKLFDKGLTFEELIQLPNDLFSDLFNYDFRIIKLFDIGMTFEQFKQHGEYLKDLEYLEKNIDSVNKILGWGISFQDFLECLIFLKPDVRDVSFHDDILFALVRTGANYQKVKGILLLKSQNDVFIENFINEIGLKGFVSVSQFRILTEEQLSLLTNAKTKSKLLALFEKHTIDFDTFLKLDAKQIKAMLK